MVLPILCPLDSTYYTLCCLLFTIVPHFWSIIPFRTLTLFCFLFHRCVCGTHQSAGALLVVWANKDPIPEDRLYEEGLVGRAASAFQKQLFILLEYSMEGNCRRVQITHSPKLKLKAPEMCSFYFSETSWASLLPEWEQACVPVTEHLCITGYGTFGDLHG